MLALATCGMTLTPIRRSRSYPRPGTQSQKPLAFRHAKPAIVTEPPGVSRCETAAIETKPLEPDPPPRLRRFGEVHRTRSAKVDPVDTGEGSAVPAAFRPPFGPA
jgi:hypothetical protein